MRLCGKRDNRQNGELRNLNDMLEQGENAITDECNICCRVFNDVNDV